MCANANTAEDRTSIVEPAINPSMPWRIKQVEVLPEYRLYVRFIDGLEGYVNMKNFLFSDHAGIFVQLRDVELFSQATLVYGAVTWPGELDLAPDAMYDGIKATGEWDMGL
jgi:hypothetical protein